MKKILFFAIIFVINITLVNAQWVQTNCPTTNSSIPMIPMITQGINVYVGGYEGVFLSSDNGNNWTSINNGLTSYHVNSFATNDSFIFAGTDAGVFLSNNNGGLWTPINNGLTGTIRIKSIVTNGNMIFALSTYSGNSQIYFSNNNGGLWTLVNNGYGYIYSLAINNSNVYALSYAGVYLSTDNGSTWNKINNGLPTDGSVVSLAFKGNNIYAGGNGMYFSSDNGNSWTFLSNSQNLSMCSISIYDTTIFVATHHGVYFSSNNGNSWNEFNTGFPYDTTEFYLVNNGNYLFSSDSIGVWRRPLSDIQPPCNASFTYLVDTITGKVNFTASAGTTDSSAYPINYIWNFGDSTTATTYYDTISHIYNSFGYNACLAIQTANGCSSTFCDSIVVTNSPCTVFTELKAHNPTTINGNDGYISSTVSGGTPPYTYYWSNGETTPNIYNLASGTYYLNVVDSNGCQNTFYATLYEPYDTTGGQIVDTLYTNIIDTCLNFVPDSFYIASVSVDTITHTATVVWTFTGNGQSESITTTYTYTQYGNTLVVLTLNCETKTLTTYQSYINIRPTLSVPAHENNMSLTAYPVPFSDKLNIHFTTQKAENVNIQLTDVSGRVVLSKMITAQSGINTDEINTSTLHSGMYILNIFSGNDIIRRQVVK